MMRSAIWTLALTWLLCAMAPAPAAAEDTALYFNRSGDDFQLVVAPPNDSHNPEVDTQLSNGETDIIATFLTPTGLGPRRVSSGAGFACAP